MAKVKNLGVTGCLNGVQWPAFGEVIDIDAPDSVIEALVTSGQVELVKVEKPKAAAKKVEKRPASKAGVETRQK